MERRNFLQSLGLAAGAAAAPTFGSAAETRDSMPETPIIPDRIVVLTPDDCTQGVSMIARQLGIRTLERVSDSLPAGTAIKMCATEMQGGEVFKTHHTACRLPSGYAHGDPFDLDYYDERLSRWAPRDASTTDGWPERDPGATPASELLQGISLVGLPFLPAGVWWRGHFIDTKTGLAMRGVVVYEISHDDFTLRFDILWG